jgi:hypothetical protein
MKPGMRAVLLLATVLIVSLSGPVAAQAPAPAGLPAVIPIFPLEDATLFPNASYPLHIFEPRYRAMIADALKGNRIIGMVTLQPGHEAEYEGRPPIFAIGCAGLITEYEELPDGRFNIVLGGLVKFRVTSEDNSRPYRLAAVQAVPEPLDEKKAAALTKERQRLDQLIEALSDTLGIGQIPPGEPDEQLVDELSQFLPMPRGQRQRLLEREDPLSRAVIVVGLLESLLKSMP